MKRLPRAAKRPVQQALRVMLNNPTSRGMALVIAENLRLRQETPLLRMVRDNRQVQVPTLLAVSKALKVK